MKHTQISLLDAPSNLGLRPPEAGSVPGCYKLPWALRDRGLPGLLGAQEAGSLAPPRYRAEWQPGDGDRNAEAIAAYSTALAARTGQILDAGNFPLVLGGDCSILIGNLLALKARGRYGLVFLDAHSDFRHEGNAPAIGAAAGEDLAIVTGRGDRRLVDLDGLGPYVREQDVALLGVRSNDDGLPELRALGACILTSQETRDLGEAAAQRALAAATEQTAGFWIHLDFDVVDSSEMQAVDCPEPDGLSFAELTGLVGLLVDSPHCVGLELTIYDPDLDPDGSQADAIVRFLVGVFRPNGVPPQPTK